MSGILAKGREMRPNYLWGFYLFPNCYNYGWEKPGYTGQCSEEVRRQNDELLWLWKSSSALYPSVYLQVGSRATVTNSPEPEDTLRRLFTPVPLLCFRSLWQTTPGWP